MLSYCLGVLVLVGLKLFHVWCMLGSCMLQYTEIYIFLNLIVMFGHVMNYPSFMAWRSVCFNGMIIVAWYHFYLSGLVISISAFKVVVLGGVGVGGAMEARFTCHTHDDPLWWSNNTVYFCLPTFRLAGMKVDVQSSSYSCTMEMRAPDFRWVNMCAALYLVSIKVPRLISYLLFAWTKIPSRIMSWFPLYIYNFLVQGMLNLM